MFSGGEHMLLRWFDIHHLFQLKFEVMDCAPRTQVQDIVKECLTLAEEYATHTEAISQDGTLLYLQDTSATHISSFGKVVYKVSSGEDVPLNPVALLSRLASGAQIAGPGASTLTRLL